MPKVTTDSRYYSDIASAIRSKNGSEAQYKPSEMSAAIDALETGGTAGQGLNWADLSSFQLSRECELTELVADIPNVTSLYCSFQNASKLTRVELTVTDKLTNMSRMFNNGKTCPLKEMTFHGDLSKVTTLWYAFSCGGNGLELEMTKIHGLDFTSVTNADEWISCRGGITDITINPHTVNISLGFKHQPKLTVESCVNILNALKDRTDQSALTLTVTNELKAAETGRLHTNWVKLNSDTDLYESCEQSDEGAMTIAAAIVAKNWTIA